MNPLAAESDLKTLTLAMSNDDDDDFQNPSQAIAISQNLILSSIKKPSTSQPLKPSNGAPPRKRQKPSVSTGKENPRASQTRRSGNPRVSRACDAKKAARDGRKSLSGYSKSSEEIAVESSNLTSAESNLVDICHGNSRVSSLCNGIKHVGEVICDLSASVGLEGEGSHDLGEKWNNEERAFETSQVPCSIVELNNLSVKIGSGSTEVPLVSSSSQCASNDYDQTKPIATEYGDSEGVEHEEEKPSLLTPKESQIVENSQIEELVCEAFVACEDIAKLKDHKSEVVESLQNGKFEKGGYYSMSIESRLLGSRAKSGPPNVEVDCGNFDPGTQLNVLMDLCCEVGSSSSRDLLMEENDFGFESTELLMDGFVECPLCGTDITDLSEDLRHVHTNECLDFTEKNECPDKDGTPEVAKPICETKSDRPQKLDDVNPVIEWLRKLDLSRYEEAFIREEVDWETLQWLTEEDLLNIGVVALGPRKKIIHSLNDLRQKGHHEQTAESDISNKSINKNSKLCIPRNKMITEFFQGPSVHRNSICSLSSRPNGVQETAKDSARKRVGARNHVSRGKVRDIPPWCCIPGTPFRVDAFRFLRGDCSHWFLTHFHMDHYQGLTRNFCHGKIYCSSITAHLVNMKIGVPWEKLHVLPLNQKITIAGVKLTCLDANHCPGSIIILFEPPNGKAVLHTGDFRFSSEMESSSVLQSCHVNTLILDTTYCNPQYDFPKQDAVIQFVIEAIQAEAFNPKTLFLIGSYTIGKERLFLEVARLLRKKVYVGAAKLRLLRCLGLPEGEMQWFTANEMESHIHVVPMWTIASFKRMKHISNQYSNRFSLIVAFSPTGWTFGKGKKKTPGRRWQQGTIIRYEVPYSEHCSFTELRDFVRFISPDHIIPSVNNEGPESADAMIALLMSDP